jgi:L-ascorbate metabolism protein UlaG (beta-lactamase superfamily)
MSVTLTWIGHATWLIDTGDGVLLVDPFLDECPTASLKAKDVRCDAILVTHAHADHVADAAAIAARLMVPVLCNFEIANRLGTQGVKTAQPMNYGGRLAVPGGTAKMEIAHHSSSFADGTYGGNPGGWLLDVGGKRIYIAGDTSVFLDMERIGRRDRAGRGLDAAILPIGDVFTMGPDDSLEALAMLTPKAVLPSHYNTWPPISQDAAAWASAVTAAGLATPHVLEPGESVTLE